MKAGIIPSSWLAVTHVWAAHDLLDLLAEVDQRGIAHTDLTAVANVWEEMRARESADEEGEA